MSAAQVLLCTKLAIYHQSLKSVRPETTICILSCITNFICDAPSTSSTVSLRVGPVIDEFFRLVTESCKSHPTRKYLICPPMYRMYPIWFRDSISEILTRFSQGYAVAATGLINLHALPGFPNPGFDADGVHLTAYSGMEFVLHLFDSSKITLDTLKSCTEARQTHVSESTRALGDRLIAVEQDHRRLATAFDLKFAKDAELACLRANERSEDSFIITGLNRLKDGLTGREWQAAAKLEVLRVLKLFIDRSFNIVVVHNVTGRSTASPVSFSVKLDSVEDSRLIRAKFGSFFSGKRDSRPPGLKDISVRNVLTKETRIRLSIMKILGQRYKDSNPGSEFQV
jgi:hypothetical protein